MSLIMCHNSIKLHGDYNAYTVLLSSLNTMLYPLVATTYIMAVISVHTYTVIINF